MPETRQSKAGNKPTKAASAPATKRKAADDASPIAAKKTKAVKATQNAKSKSKAQIPETEPTKTKKQAKKEVVPSDEPEEDESPLASDDEADEANALAEVIDGDNDDDAPVDEEAEFKEGQDVGKIPKPTKEIERKSKSGDSEPGVVYIGRIPHGFYEHEMRQYFSQFGPINKLRLSRSKATGASKHFGFIEFEEHTTAEIVAKTMDNYLLFGHILKCKMVPQSQIHDALWKGANKRFKKIPWNKMAGNKLKKPLTESGWNKKVDKEQRRRSVRSQKLAEMGYEFDQPSLKQAGDGGDAAAVEAPEEEAPKAIEAPPKATKQTGAKGAKKATKGKKAKA